MGLFGLKYENVDRYFDSYAKYIIRQAKNRLSKRSNTGRLRDSLDYTIFKNRVGQRDIRFTSVAYGDYVQRGVSGTETQRTFIDVDGRRKRSPYKYSTKQPPVSALELWIKTKGFGRVRGAGGKFISHKTLAFFMSRSIKKRGIRSVSFFTQPISASWKVFKQKLVENFAKDIEAEIENKFSIKI